MASPIRFKSSYWLDQVYPENRELLSPLQACVYERISIKQQNKKDPHGYKKYYPLTIFTTGRNHRTVYIYKAALRFLRIPQHKMEQKRRSSERYQYVAHKLKKLSQESKWKLELFHPIFKEYTANERIVGQLRPADVNPTFPSYNKRILVQLFLESIQNMSRFIRYKTFTQPMTPEDKLLHTTTWKRSEGTFSASIERGTVSIISPIAAHVGQGSYCAAYRVFNYTLGRVQVLVTPQFTEHPTTDDEEFRNTRKVKHSMHSIKIINLIHQNKLGYLPGIVDAPSAVLTLLQNDSTTIYQEMVMTEYSYPLDEYCFSSENPTYPPSILLNGIRQLFEGLNFLRTAKIIHGDIKPENIFVKGNGCFSIADFGGSLLQSKAKRDLENVVQTSFTADCLNGKDLVALVKTTMNGRLSEWAKIGYARDLAAVALSILQMVAREEISPQSNAHKSELKRVLKGYKDIGDVSRVYEIPLFLDLSKITKTQISDSFKKAGIDSPAMTTLFSRCLSNCYGERPGPRRVLEDLDPIVHSLKSTKGSVKV
jgi:hypothetical protein